MLPTSPDTFSRLRRGGLHRAMIGATTAGVAGTAMMTTNAAIIHSGPQNLSTSSLIGVVFAEDTEGVNVDGSGGDEFTLSSFGEKGSDFHDVWGESAGFDTISHPSLSHLVLRMQAGELIDANSSFGNQVEVINNQTDLFPPDPTLWNANSDDYFGFRFNPSGTQDLYGWAHVTISPDRAVMTLVEWAYEDSGAPIHAGQTPEPTTCLLLAGGLASAALWRRCTKKKKTS